MLTDKQKKTVVTEIKKLRQLRSIESHVLAEYLARLVYEPLMDGFYLLDRLEHMARLASGMRTELGPMLRPAPLEKK